MDHISFSELLLKRGLVSREKLLAAKLEQTVTHERIGKILVRNGFLKQTALFKLLREVAPNALHDESSFQDTIPAEVLIETQSMLTAEVDGTLYVSTLSSPGKVRAMMAPFLGTTKLEFTSVNPVRLSQYLSQLTVTQEADALSWERIFQDAMRTRASDIHIIPRFSSYTIKFRRDGVLHLIHEGTLDDHIALVSRIKDLSRMDMAERRRPQDGGFSMEYAGRIVNFRVVTVPTVTGERMVVRILDPDATHLELGQLGISRIAQWRRAVSRSDGLCLICGPTGSGKTTTLAATVREMNFLERAVYSAEDPVENSIPYAGQVNMNPAVDLNFSSAVRTFMRADPDVIIVGEVRDIDTARNALKASETGHLVLATLHTGSIINALGRLRDIGVAPYELRHLLRGVMVQRLMRVFCLSCGGKGCDACQGSGYKGREVISEVQCFDTEHDVERLLNGEVTWPLLLEDARLKVREGKTSNYELERVFGQGFSEGEDDLTADDLPPEVS